MKLSESPKEHLTLHELIILRALANGAQSKEMASLIKRSRGTVEFYVRSLFLKLNARSRPHLVAQAFRSGVLTLTPADAPAHVSEFANSFASGIFRTSNSV